MKKLLLLSVLLSSCGTGEILAPVTTPSPSPSASVSPVVNNCFHAYSDIRGDAYVAGLGPKNLYTLFVIPFNASDTPLDNTCDYSRNVGWSLDGPCRAVGPLNAFKFQYYCEKAGILNVLAIHGRFVIPFRVVVEE